MTARIVILLIVLSLALGACSAPPSETAIRVILVADGQRTEITTEATTVRQVLEQANVTLGEMDRVRPPETFAISNGTVITITRIVQRFETETRVLPYDQRIVRDASIPVGQQRVLQAGRNGQLEITYRLVFEDGKQVERVEVKREVIQSPQSEVVLIGIAHAQSSVPFTGTLVYLANNNAFVMRQASGNRRALTAEGDLDGWVFALSPDGKTLLYTRAISPTGENAPLNTLWTIDTVRADAQPQKTRLTGLLWAGWSPDGRNIAYSTGEPTVGPPGWRASNDLWLAPFYSLSGAIGAPTQVLTPSTGGTYGWWGSTFAWSPDGASIAIGSTTSISLVNLKARKPQRTALVSFVAINTYSDWAWTPTVAWTPDSRFVLTVLPGLAPAGQPPAETPVFDVWALAADGSFRAKLAAEAGMWAAPRSPSTFHFPLSTPILFGRAETPYSSDRSRYILYVMDRDGSNRYRLFPSEGVAGVQGTEGGPGLKGLPRLAWSPDGSQIALVYQGDLYLVDVAGGGVQQLTSEGNIKLVQWAR